MGLHNSCRPNRAHIRKLFVSGNKRNQRNILVLRESDDEYGFASSKHIFQYSRFAGRVLQLGYAIYHISLTIELRIINNIVIIFSPYIPFIIGINNASVHTIYKRVIKDFIFVISTSYCTAAQSMS